ncbi:hypothetical protein Leryth_022669 [Lithospermum erythrorhizon]|nr:hypothetical protein Leryth_022669 [Lithospermum erythrorhizon]
MGTSLLVGLLLLLLHEGFLWMNKNGCLNFKEDMALLTSVSENGQNMAGQGGFLGVGMNFMLLMPEFAAFVVVWKEVELEIEFCCRKFWPENCRVDNRRRKTPSSPVNVAVDPVNWSLDILSIFFGKLRYEITKLPLIFNN